MLRIEYFDKNRFMKQVAASRGSVILHLDNGSTCDLKKDNEASAIFQTLDAPKKGFSISVSDPADVTGFLRYMLEAGRDRAVLRAIHYFEENARTLAQRDALVAGDFAAFARLVEKSGHSSFECCQNVYCASSPKHQGLSAALAISQSILAGTGGAWRMQGGGFAGTIQAFVPDALIKRYCAAMEALFGPGCCYLLSLREQGAVRVM